MREITFTDFIQQCGNVRRAEEALRQHCPGFELVDYAVLDDTPSIGDLISRCEEER
jgi:hypothetical protein